MKRLKAWLPALAWMGVIFLMSAMPGETSGEQSGRILRLVTGLVAFLFGEQAAAGIDLDMLHLLIRKAAHMAEYAVLFMLYRRALRLEDAGRPGLWALMLCACYAATDEFHQSFTEGRGPSAMDVGIDTLGAAAAWVLTKLISQIKKER